MACSRREHRRLWILVLLAIPWTWPFLQILLSQSVLLLFIVATLYMDSSRPPIISLLRRTNHHFILLYTNPNTQSCLPYGNDFFLNPPPFCQNSFLPFTSTMSYPFAIQRMRTLLWSKWVPSFHFKLLHYSMIFYHAIILFQILLMIGFIRIWLMWTEIKSLLELIIYNTRYGRISTLPIVLRLAFCLCL